MPLSFFIFILSSCGLHPPPPTPLFSSSFSPSPISPLLSLSVCQVFSMFLETLVDFITLHKEDLQDWLFVLLTQLLKKMGADLLGSVQAKVQKALDVTRSESSAVLSERSFFCLWPCDYYFTLCRESFPFEQQFNILMRFIVDQTQTPNLKVKVAILRYIEALARQMDPADFANSSETRLAISRIITWTTEPKSSDVRKVSRRVHVKCFPYHLFPL